MGERCWFASLPGAGPCDGRLVRCHLIPRQQIARTVQYAADYETPGQLNGEILRRNSDPRCWVWGCGGIMGNAGHHGMLDASRTLRIPRERLPAGLEEFAVELGLEWWLDREYGDAGS